MGYYKAAVIAAAVFTAGAANAASITLSGQDLIDAETTVGGEFGYQIDLSGLGLVSIDAITIVDSEVRKETGGQTTGFDVDALVVGKSTASFTTASSYDFTAGGVSGGTQLFGATAGNAAVDDAVATLGVFDGVASPFTGFLSLGNGGSLTAMFSPAVDLGGSLFIFAREIGTNERLASVTIEGTVPLPAGGVLLLSGLGAAAALRRRRKAG